MITGESIVPETTYSVLLELPGGARSEPVVVSTGRWGDVVGATIESAPDGLVDFRDVAGLVRCFLDDVTAPSLYQCDLYPDLPDGVIDFRDIRTMVQAFLHDAYPYSVPPDCAGP